MENLPELRDIHIPDGVSAFPPAYGWWVILLGFMTLILLAELHVMWRRKSRRLYALKLIGDIKDDAVILAAKEMSDILRRICVIKYPEAAVYIGQEWIDFLNIHTKNKIVGKEARLLIEAPYTRPHTDDYNKEDLEKLREFCRSWVGENL